MQKVAALVIIAVSLMVTSCVPVGVRSGYYHGYHDRRDVYLRPHFGYWDKEYPHRHYDEFPFRSILYDYHHRHYRGDHDWSHRKKYLRKYRYNNHKYYHRSHRWRGDRDRR